MTGSPDEPLVIAGTRKAAKELADGTLRVQIDIEPRDKQAFHRSFPEIDMPVAIAPLKPMTGLVEADTGDIDTAALDMRPGKIMPTISEYGQNANRLRKSGFFRNPDVWKAIGSDSEYQDWIRKQPCIVCGDADYPEEHPDGICEASHVRRIEHGAGTGIKPPYHCVPMCHSHHSVQHNEGETTAYCMARYPLGQEATNSGQERLAHMWLDREWMKHIEQWAWETLKAQLGYDSWAKIPPGTLFDWAEDHHLVRFLPDCYTES